MIDINQITQTGREKREANERKKILNQLAKDIKFESRMFASEFKYNTKEDLRYYLWQCELHKWLNNMYGEKLDDLIINWNSTYGMESN